jgi:putative hydrolase of the HAD superfamily
MDSNRIEARNVGKPMPMRRPGLRLHLIIDADDTLWENNVYFERAIDEFIDFIDHSTMTRAEIRATFNEIERATARVHGYGARAFASSLRECYQRLSDRVADEANFHTVMRFGERILEQEIELLPGVEQTLRDLAARHHLVLFTKGHLEEQRLKIERSGIGSHFAHHEIVAEKNSDSYRALIERVGIAPAQGWMVGNSPRSDINPALAAGLGAVFIPHGQTWSLEHDEIDRGSDRLIVIERFPQLLDLF